MKKKALLIWIPLVALLCNGAGYLIVSNVRSKSAGNGATGSRPATHPSDVRPEEATEKEASARARRAAGLAALDSGDYEKALINFTEARALVGEHARVDDLLRITEDLRSRARAPSPPGSQAPVALATPPFRWVAPTRPITRYQPPARAPSEPAAIEARSAGSSSNTGILLVTTTPRGLLVQVDGAPVDLTPMRTALKPGVHRVALLDGDRRLYETSVDVTDGNATTLLRDLSAEFASEPPRSALANAAPKEEPTRAAAPAPPPEPVAAPAARATTSDTGGLDVTSPGLYGVVWVNDRPYGFPPVSLRDLPAGAARIEVRVNGVEKRSTTVVVQPGVNTAVKMR